MILSNINFDNDMVKDFLSRFGFARDINASEEDVTDSIFLRQSNNVKKSIIGSGKSGGVKGLFAADVVINGSIISGSDMIIEGVVNGDIKCKGNIEIRGSINGNVECVNAVMSGANILGDMTTNESIVLESGSTINGSLKTNNAYINGVVTGNIEVLELVTVLGMATIDGNISASSILIAQSATINGQLNTTKKERTAERLEL